MASVDEYILEDIDNFYVDFQKRCDMIEAERRHRYLAARTIQRHVRGFILRSNLQHWHYCARIIQKIYRGYAGKKMYRRALLDNINRRLLKFYNAKANIIQKVFRGYWTREYIFSYSSFKLWMLKVNEVNAEVICQNNLYREVTRQHRLDKIEQTARDWIVFILFKLHHLLRTYQIEGIYSQQYKNELTTFEKMLKQVKYTEYMKKLRGRCCDYMKSERPPSHFPTISESTLKKGPGPVQNKSFDLCGQRLRFDESTLNYIEMHVNSLFKK